MKRKIFKLMAYVYIPIVFTFIGYGMIYIASLPAMDMLKATGSMVLYNENKKSEVVPLKIENDLNEASMTPNDLEVHSADNVILMKDIQFPDYGTRYANLTCNRIELDAPVYWGDTEEILIKGVGQFMGSFLPGLSRSILLSGHNTMYFKAFELIDIGDIMQLHTNYGVFEYEVSEMQIIHSEDAENMVNEMLSYQEEKLIMYTCYPFETLVGTKMERLFVFADKISGPVVE